MLFDEELINLFNLVSPDNTNDVSRKIMTMAIMQSLSADLFIKT